MKIKDLKEAITRKTWFAIMSIGGDALRPPTIGEIGTYAGKLPAYTAGMKFIDNWVKTREGWSDGDRQQYLKPSIAHQGMTTWYAGDLYEGEEAVMLTIKKDAYADEEDLYKLLHHYKKQEFKKLGLDSSIFDDLEKQMKEMGVDL